MKNLTDYIPKVDSANLLEITGLTSGEMTEKLTDIYKEAVFSFRERGTSGEVVPGDMLVDIAKKIDSTFPKASLVLRTLMWENVCRESLNTYHMEVIRKRADDFARETGIAQAMDKLNKRS